jgi:hypothetical protein
MHQFFPFKRASLTWKVTDLEMTRDGLMSPSCQKCRTPLDVHQPDENDPRRLLGICGACHTWHFIEVAPDDSRALLFNMPCVEFIRAKSALSRTGSEQGPHPTPEARSLQEIGAGQQVA